MRFVLTSGVGWGPCLDLLAVEERFLIINYQTNKLGFQDEQATK
jgi:hypothetical protein